MSNQIGLTGLKVNVRSLEVGQWRDILYAVKPWDKHSDPQLIGGSDPVLDSSRQLLTAYARGGRISEWCDDAFTAKLNNVLALTGVPRSKGFQELWATAYQRNVLIPLVGLNFIHGISPKLHWDPRPDGVVNFNEWKLDK